MNKTKAPSWQAIRDEVFRRISERVWQPGQQIPKETELAAEFNCARATVNRALQQLADEGLLDRRRKGGSKVAALPSRKATLTIPITRIEIEQRGARYRHQLISRAQVLPPENIREKMKTSASTPLLHLRALHLADDKPFLYEERWINTATAPRILELDFKELSANEWLVENAIFTHGDIIFSAANATAEEANFLKIDINTAIFIVDRTTWNDKDSVTSVRLAYQHGYQMETKV